MASPTPTSSLQVSLTILPTSLTILPTSLTILPTTDTSIPTSLLASLTSTATASSSSNSDFPSPAPAGGKRSASYFFGFLVAFVALLLFFVGCGLGARRRLLRRRGRLQVLFGGGFDDSVVGGLGGLSVDELSRRNAEPGFKEPAFWDRGFKRGGDYWESMLPLSASVIPDEKNMSENMQQGLPFMSLPLTPNWLTPREPPPRRNWWANGDGRGFWWTPRLLRFGRGPSPSPATGPDSVPLTAVISPSPSLLSPSSVPMPLPMPLDGDQTPPDGVKLPMPDPMPPVPLSQVQIVVTISMPSQRDPSEITEEDREGEEPGEIQFGVAQVPLMWDDSISESS
ncbi:hypothetical protein AX17_004630 [Amanita inopinata Kibby_2008]|nr:hypothetical protein AX17_004630 [Amanita inopinata Kibby_2008]